MANADIEKYRFDKIGLFIWDKTQINNRSARA
jgi:hypothetical protein